MVRKRQQGAALLMVLMVLAMIAGGLAKLVQEGREQVDGVHLLQQRVQARALEQAGLAFVEQTLRDSRWRASPLFWQALRGQPLPYEFAGGSATLRIRDLHSCFNVNALIGEDAERAERQLHHLLGGSMAAEQLIQALADWLDGDHQARINGAENDHYLRQSPARLAANQMMLDMSELNLLISPDPQRQARYPQLCALPESAGWRLNANALTLDQLPLLDALYEGEVSRSLLTRIVSGRPLGGYRDSGDLRQALGALDDASFARLSEGLLLNSGDFLLQLEIEQDARVLRSQYHVHARGVVQWHALVPAQQVRVTRREPLPW